MKSLLFLIVMLTGTVLMGQGTKQPPSLRESVSRHFDEVNQKVLEMAKDFPAEKYNYRPSQELRSFHEVIVHIFSGNVYAGKVVRGEKVKWDELKPTDYATKNDVVAALEKSIADAKAALAAEPDTKLAATPEPWLSVIEHSAEHYGQLVQYYRNNKLVPPESRKQQSGS